MPKTPYISTDLLFLYPAGGVDHQSMDEVILYFKRGKEFYSNEIRSILTIHDFYPGTAVLLLYRKRQLTAGATVPPFGEPVICQS